MKIKRFLSLALALCMLSGALCLMCSCDNNAVSGVTRLYVYNWGEYMSDGSEGSLNSNLAFEQWYYETYGERVEVVYSTFSSNEDMYAKLTSGSVNYDVVVPSDYMIERLIDENWLLPLNYDNIPNIQNIIPEFHGDNAEYDYFDKGNVYSVPYFYGMIGIIYNTKVVDVADLGSWGLMWNHKYKGNILQFNNSRDAFGTAQYYLGIDVNTDNEDEWRMALDKLKEQKDIVQGYVMDEVFNKMENGSAAISAYYAGDFLTMYEKNPDLDIFYPKEGTNLYVDAMCVPKTSQNPEIAERYINFMLSEEPAVANAEYTYYASPNRLVMENEEYIEYMSEIKDDAYEKIYALDSTHATYYKNMTPEKIALVNGLWEDLKSDIEVSPTIYVMCAVIVGALVFIGVFLGIRKKVRNNY